MSKKKSEISVFCCDVVPLPDPILLGRPDTRGEEEGATRITDMYVVLVGTGNPEHFAPELYGKIFGVTYDPLYILPTYLPST